MNISSLAKKVCSSRPLTTSPVSNELICNACLRRESNAPVQAIINRNSQSLLRRQVEETKEEIKKVMSRVNSIYSSLVQNEIESFPDDTSIPSFEYISDIHQLETILKDEVKKELYQNQVTVFIVGHTALCEQKLNLISQLNEFFIMNSKLFIDEAWEEQIDAEFDFDSVSHNVRDSLTTAAVLSNRLSEINKEMVQYFTRQAKSSTTNLKFKGKRKLEKSLQQSKEEIHGLQEKLQQMLAHLETRDEQVTDLTNQLEKKKNECQELKMAASMNYHYLGNMKTLEEEVKEKNVEISELQKDIADLESNIKDLKLTQVVSPSKLDSFIKQNEESILDLKEKLENSLIDEEEALETAEAFHNLQIQDLSVNHREEIVELEMNHKRSLLEIMEAKGSHKEGSQKGTSTKKSKSVTKQKSKGDSKTGKSSKNKDVKENTDSTQASGAGAKEKGESTAKTTKTQSKLSKMVKQAPVETTVDHSVLETLEAFDLTDNEAWAGLPSEQMAERFVQYRWLTTKKLKELDEQLKLMTLRTQRKVESLKSQFQEHKVKWEEERDLLKQQVVQLKGLQVAAEKEADAVMTQLEDFINEQEKMEIQESIDDENIGEESKCMGSPKSRISDLQCENKSKDLHMIPMKEAKETATTKCVSDSAILISNKLNKVSHSPKRGNSKVIESINLTDRKLKSPIAPIAAINTIEGNEIQSPHNLSSREEHSTKMKDAKLSLAGMQFHHPSEEFSGDGDKNPLPVSLNNHPDELVSHLTSGEQLGVNTDSTSQTLNNEMYNIILKFKENLTKVISHKDVKYAKEIIEDIDSIIKEDNFNADAETNSNDVFKSIQQTLKDITQLIYDQFQQQQVQQLSNEKSYPSLDSESLPTDNQRQILSATISEKSANPNNNNNKIALRELMDLYNQLQYQIIEDTQKHEAEQRHNTVIMMEMQHKITSLQHQLELARKIHKNSAIQNPQYQPPVMFTRLDLERNAKIMTRAVASQHISDQRYKDILQQMSDYVSLPVLRFQQLVHRYVHHCRLKEIYDYIKHQSDYNQFRGGGGGGGANIKKTFLLQKVVNVHHQCVNRWYEQAVVMSMERQSQASALTETLEDLEAESGLFLIKPIYTNRIKPGSRDSKLHRKKNIINSKVPNNSSHFKQTVTGNSATTNISFDHSSKNNFDLDSCDFHQQKDQSNRFLIPNCNRQGHTSPPMWAISMSQSSFQSNLKNTSESDHFEDSMAKATATASVIAYGSMSTAPRILELDINRMLIGQNNVSIKINPPTVDESQQLNLRSYLSVCRPTAMPRSRLGCSGQPLSNITNSYYEVKTPPVSRLCTPKTNHEEQFIQIDPLPIQSQLEKIPLPPITSHVMTQMSVEHDNYLASK